MEASENGGVFPRNKNGEVSHWHVRFRGASLQDFVVSVGKDEREFADILLAILRSLEPEKQGDNAQLRRISQERLKQLRRGDLGEADAGKRESCIVVSDDTATQEGSEPAASSSSSAGQSAASKAAEPRCDEEAASSPALKIELDCVVCFEEFNDSTRAPFLSRCGHTFCESCMKKFIGKRKTYDCPTCRQTLPNNAFTKNFWIIQNLPALLQQRASSSKRGPPKTAEAEVSQRAKKPRSERRKPSAEAGLPVAAATAAVAAPSGAAVEAVQEITAAGVAEEAEVHVGCQEVVGDIPRMTVRGGTHAVFSRILQGSFMRNGQQNHGRPVYVKENDSLNGVFVYYWDTRDGESLSGWWFGPVVGGAAYWAYHPNSSAQTPPRSGWQIAGGEVDPTMVLGPAPGRSEAEASSPRTLVRLSGSLGSSEQPTVLHQADRQWRPTAWGTRSWQSYGGWNKNHDEWNKGWSRRASWGGSWTTTSGGNEGDDWTDRDWTDRGDDPGPEDRGPERHRRGDGGGPHEGGRGPTERLVVPTFAGDADGDELGTSARSYIRQIKAWQRMTKLSEDKQALVLYQQLTGPAWVEAERLDVDQLGSRRGMEYYVQWVRDRYLDVQDDAEELFESYMTHVSAKQKYRDQSRMRGSDPEALKRVAAEKLQMVKARSFCSGCRRRGHWHKDPECPLNQGKQTGQGGRGGGATTTPATAPTTSTGTSGTAPICENYPCHVVHVTWDLDQEKAPLLITDTACSKTVVNVKDAFKFGASRIFESTYAVIVNFVLGGYLVRIRVCVVNGDVPLLLSRGALGAMGMVLDVAENCADFRKVGVQSLQLEVTSTGHPALPVHPEPVPRGADSFSQGSRSELQLIKKESQYMVFAATCSASEAAAENEGRTIVCYALNTSFGDARSFPPLSLHYGSAKQCLLGSPCSPLLLSRLLSRTTMAPKSALLTAPVKVKGLWDLSKSELLDEAQARGLWVNPVWSVPEIRSIIQEDMNTWTPAQAASPPGISNMSLAALVSTAEDLGIRVPDGATKGSIMRLIRDGAGGGSQQVMTFGRYKSYLYSETPVGYRRWAIAEVMANENHSEELRMYANWCKANMENSTKPARYVDEDDPELKARTPYVPEESDTQHSWEPLARAPWRCFPERPPEHCEGQGEGEGWRRETQCPGIYHERTGLPCHGIRGRPGSVGRDRPSGDPPRSYQGSPRTLPLLRGGDPFSTLIGERPGESRGIGAFHVGSRLDVIVEETSEDYQDETERNDYEEKDGGYV
eukprot:s160_g25.t1